MSAIKVLFTGTRRMRDDRLIKLAVSELPSTNFALWIHGAGPGADGAPGCDMLVDRLADSSGISKRTFPADWDKFLFQAGPMRNTDMVNFGADVCLAFPDRWSKGTWDCLRKAVAAGIPTRIYPVKS